MLTVSLLHKFGKAPWNVDRVLAPVLLANVALDPSVCIHLILVLLLCANRNQTVGRPVITATPRAATISMVRVVLKTIHLPDQTQVQSHASRLERCRMVELESSSAPNLEL